MKGQISFREYYRQAAWVSLAFILVLGVKLLLSSEANGATSKISPFSPAEVATDLQKKPDHARIGVSAECFGLLPASKEKWLNPSLGTVGEINTIAFLLFTGHEFVGYEILIIRRTLSIYQLNCCYRI